MNIVKDKCVAYFIEKRLLLDAKEFDGQKQQAAHSIVENTKVKVNLDKYHSLIVVSVLIYIVLVFTLLR